MIRIYEKSDSQFNNLAAAWSKMTHLDKNLFEVSAIILASDHQEEEAEIVAAALKGSTASRTEKFTSVMPCIMVCLLCEIQVPSGENELIR
ncbi:hypothetical protein [Bacillus inaquosorum]|uniref:hypothetical protein n=1 Tax=Bacillus inaquosorum TaxID=483913 RepID=UPI00227E2650|nr:hypothetical protein [Bacillus inaquosorum]MCY8420270.1 hypothetical protein [Bacillus inaquosorum]MCY9175156.1 hypothetical protein [Bacillus inaquosorum]MEC0978983.1 hypothetical protein [Bacillus inaquosorum]